VKGFKLQRLSVSVTVAVIIVLVASNIVTSSFLIHTNLTRQGGHQKYPLIDVARNYIPQEHFIVNIQPLREQLQKIVKDNGPDSISVYFETLNSGANIQINNDTRFYPASLVKLPSAMAAMKKIEKGEWHLDNRLVLLDQDKDSRFGTLYRQPVGTSFSIEELLQALLLQSDDTAHHILMRNLSEDELNDLKNNTGLNDLFNEKGEISAKEYSRMFRSLYESSYLKRDGSQQILQWLSQTPFNDMLASALPKSVAFAHKIGEDDINKSYLDSGIVYLPNRPFMLTVMIKQHDQNKANDIMGQISRAAYNYIQDYAQK
jgi:beta-lactamase class A